MNPTNREPRPEMYDCGGFPPFPNLYNDMEELHTLGDTIEWPQARLDYKTHEYGQFLQRPDLMERAKRSANFILDRLLFEQAYRDGVYSE